MKRIGTAILALLVLAAPGCVKDQQAARTRNSGVDKEPEKHEKETPKHLENPPPEEEEELPPVDPPK